MKAAGLSPVAVIGDKQALPVDEIVHVARLDLGRRGPLRARAVSALQPIAIQAFLRSAGHLVARSLPRIDPQWGLPANLVGGIVAILLIWWATAGGEHRTVTLRIAWPPRFSAITLGIHGVALAYAMMLPLAFVLAPHFGEGRSTDIAWIPGWLMLPAALSIGFWEELLFRGLLLSRLRTLFSDSQSGLWSAILVSSAFFSLAHGYQGGLGVIQAFTTGIVLAYLVVMTESLWPAVLAHAGIDFIAMAIGHR